MSYTDFSTISVYKGEEMQLADTVARLYAWLPRLPVACAHVTPLGGGSLVGGHGDVLAGGQRGP